MRTREKERENAGGGRGTTYDEVRYISPESDDVKKAVLVNLGPLVRPSHSANWSAGDEFDGGDAMILFCRLLRQALLLLLLLVGFETCGEVE